MLKINYLVKAALLLPKLELRLLYKKYQPLSRKMGIMCDDNQVQDLPDRHLPIRVNGNGEAVQHHKGLKIYVYPNGVKPDGILIGVDIHEIGNELENGAMFPDGKGYSIPEYMSYVRRWNGSKPIANPGITSINQSVSYWRKLLDAGLEDAVDYLAIHFYIQSRKMDRVDDTWVEKKWYRKLSDKWEYIKSIAALMEFRDRTHKQILVTECGVCQLTAEIPEDVQWMDVILSEVLGDRMEAACWYNYIELIDYPGKAILAYY